MTKPAWIASSLAIEALLVFASFAQAADVRQTKQLTDRQLDKIAAGAVAYASGDSSANGGVAAGAVAYASGDSSANGAAAFTDATATTDGRSDTQSTVVNGQTRGIAMANANFSASASSSLHLSYSSLGGTR